MGRCRNWRVRPTGIEPVFSPEREQYYRVQLYHAVPEGPLIGTVEPGALLCGHFTSTTAL
jgi:hypothetical protein